MKELTVIILYSKKFFRNTIMVLERILKTYDTELIVVGDEIIDEEVSFKYESVSFTDEDTNLKNNLISSASSNRVLFIDSALILTTDFVDFLIDSIARDSCFNISVPIKSLIDKEKDEYFIHYEILLINKGVKGFNKQYKGQELMDYSYINCPQKNIGMYINNLLENSNYKELYTWFSYYVSSLSKKEKSTCFTAIEKIKALYKDRKLSYLDSIFIEDSIDKKYSNYLSLKRDYKDDTYSKDIFSNILSSVDGYDYYFSWLLKDIFLLNKEGISLLSYLKEDTLKNLIVYLFENDEGAWSFISSFISKSSSNLREIKDRYSIFDKGARGSKTLVDTFVNLAVVTIEYMNLNVATPINKEILLTTFLDYVKISESLIKLGYFKGKSTLVDKKAEEKLVLNVADYNLLTPKERIASLAELCSKNSRKVNTLRYLIQKIRFENSEYLKTLSICLIVRDEGKNMDRCLSSLTPLLECNLAELIVVDTGSKDDTIKIAKRYTEKVYFHKWENNFSTARNQSLMYADGEYIFIMDADEELAKKDMELIKEEFSKTDYKSYDTHLLNIVSYTDTKLEYFAVMPQPRIFRNDCVFHYSSSVHNQAVCTPPVKNLDIDILHYGYIMTPDVKEKKYKRTVTLLKKELQKNPRNIYFNYQLSSSYAMYGDIKSALKQVELYMQLILESDELYDSVLMYYNNAAAIYINCFLYDKAEDVCDKALKIAPEFIDFNYYKAFILFEKKDYKNALLYVEKYLSLISHYNDIEVANDGRFAFYTLCSHEEVKKLSLQIHYSLEMYKECIYDMYLLTDKAMIVNSLYQFISSCIKLNELDKLDSFLKEQNENEENEILKKVFLYFRDILENKGSMKDFYSLNGYSFDSLDFDSFYPFLEEVLLEIVNLDVNSLLSDEELLKYKKILQLILHRTDDLRYYYLSDEELVDIFNNYMLICSKFTSRMDMESLEPRELLFINKMLLAFKAQSKVESLAFFHDAIVEYNLMSGIVNLTIEILLSEDEEVLEDKEQMVKEASKDGLSKETTPSKNEELIQVEFPFENKLRILHGTMDNTESTVAAVNALKKRGVYAKSLNYVPRKCSRPSDYEMDVNSFENGQVILNRTLEAAKYLILNYDIFHFYHGSSLSFTHNDIPLINKLNKKIVIQLSGEEVRRSVKAETLSPYLSIYKEKDEVILKKLKEYASYASLCIVDDEEAYEYVKDIFSKAIVIHPFVNVEEELPTKKNNKFTIVHAPISPLVAGTSHIVKAIDDIKKEYDIDFILLEGEPIESIREKLRTANLFIDGLLVGNISKYALEAMAVSTPVVSYISDFMEDKYTEVPPIIESNIDSIKETILSILLDKSNLDQIGSNGVSYVKKYHNEELFSSKLMEVYKGLF